MSGHQILLDALYGLEGRSDNKDSMLHLNCSTKGRGEKNKLYVEFLEEGPWEDEQLKILLEKEQGEELQRSFEGNPHLAKARREALEWMLMVVEHYSFSALTAILAVNYLDRFLGRFECHVEKKQWVTQLAAVACLSLAAKVEETQVPLLFDLQVEEPKYMFEPKAIQRMELLVLSTLQWRMTPVTPLSFLEYVAGSLKFGGHFCEEFLRRCECLLVSMVSDCRFLCYLPSTLATAVTVYVISSLEPCFCVEYQVHIVGIFGIDKGNVEDCCMLIQEVATSVDFHHIGSKRKFGSLLPESPKGVVDVSFSCDTSNDSWGLDFNPTSSVSSSPEPPSKKIMSQGESSNASWGLDLAPTPSVSSSP